MCLERAGFKKSRGSIVKTRSINVFFDFDEGYSKGLYTQKNIF